MLTNALNVYFSGAENTPKNTHFSPANVLGKKSDSIKYVALHFTLVAMTRPSFKMKKRYRWIIRHHTNVTGFQLCVTVARKAVHGKHVILGRITKQFKKTLNFTQYCQITLLFMLMADIFGWKLSEEVTGMITKLKMIFQSSFHIR